jgi:hypothetical protein
VHQQRRQPIARVLQDLDDIDDEEEEFEEVLTPMQQ